MSLVCFVLILKFGVLAAVNPPSKTLRGMFVLASAIAGIAGGAISIFFWKAARYGIGAWGGFAFGLWLQCFRNGGVIKAIGFRWILYIGCMVIGFILCTIPKIHYHILLISTAFVGASAFILGVDCFTTAGLKEFYIWNLGFPSLFPKFTSHGIQFPVSQTMQIELGLIAAVALMGAAVQLRILSVLHLKLQEITAEQKKRDEDAELQAAERFVDVMKEQEDWEREHSTITRHGRQESGLSTMPLMKDQDGSASPATAEHRSSTFTLVQDGRPRHHSGISDLKFSPAMEDETAPVTRSTQSPGVLPTLDLGLGIQEDVPHDFIVEDEMRKKDLTASELEELKQKEELLLEIQTIRRSIDALRSETPAPSSSGNSRRPSMTSRRTLSIDANSALLPLPSHLRPPRELDPRGRAHSLEMSTLAYSRLLDEPIDRPTSAPLRDEGWDSYVHDRKLLQPPSGITPPITTTPIDTLNKIAMPQAVTDALNQRKRRESALGLGEQTTDSSDDIPLAKMSLHQRSSSSGGNVPVTILPPRRAPAIMAPIPQRPAVTRTRTFEELNERHREKMRDLQAPLTQAQKEEADLRAARLRWERSKALEKEAVTRRQAEKAAELEKRKDEPGKAAGRRSSETRHSRSLSADRLAGISSSPKRLSTLKVEDWQKYQREVAAKPEPLSGSTSKRDSRAFKSEGVPFPDGRRSPEVRRKSRDYLS